MLPVPCNKIDKHLRYIKLYVFSDGYLKPKVIFNFHLESFPSVWSFSIFFVLTSKELSSGFLIRCHTRPSKFANFEIPRVLIYIEKESSSSRHFWLDEKALFKSEFWRVKKVIILIIDGVGANCN